MTALRLNQVTKEYPGHTALHQISFEVLKGSVHAFLGPNGAGKSTTMKILTGLIPATSGTVEVNAKVGFLPENPPLYPSMKVRDYLKFVFDIQTLKKKIPQKPENIGEVMSRCGLDAVADRLIGNLSKGYRQKVGIAQALVFHPEIIILDEPTVGLDPQAIAEIRELILSLKNDHTILLSTHQLYEAELISSHLTIINQGRVLTSGRLSDVKRSIQTTQLVKIKCREGISRLSSEIESKFQFKMIENQEKNGLQEIKLSSSNPKDQRAELLSFLALSQIGLCEFQELKPDLEEVFKQITQKGIQL